MELQQNSSHEVVRRRIYMRQEAFDFVDRKATENGVSSSVFMERLMMELDRREALSPRQ